MLWVYLDKSPKWSPYDVALSMALMGRFFEKVYKKPISMIMDPIVDHGIRS
jgi:hypothetical protein